MNIIIIITAGLITWIACNLVLNTFDLIIQKITKYISSFYFKKREKDFLENYKKIRNNKKS